MRKKLNRAATALLLVLLAASCAPKKTATAPSDGKVNVQLACVGFYNLENLFDTIDQPDVNDHEYTPNGPNKWNGHKYLSKLHNMAYAVSQIGLDRSPVGAAILGVSEVENRGVLEDLVAQPELAGRSYEIVHYDSPDRRGIDVGLLYNPRLFTVSHSVKHRFHMPEQPDFVTRDQLLVSGYLLGEKVHVIVNHWPSRGAESPVRVHAARQVKALADSLRRTDRKLKLIVMGDMNDDPMDESLRALGARKWRKEVAKDEFYNPWWEVLEDEETGTLLYRGKWNLFDQIVLSKPLLKKRRGLRYAGHEVFSPDYLFQKDGRYEGYPLRTHGGRTWLNGYSDHLPTIIYLKK